MAAPQKYSDEQMIKALTKHNGIVSSAAKSLGCSPSTIYERMAESPSVKKAREDCQEVIIDLAESALISAIKRGEAWAVSLALKTIGRRRGYGDHAELDHAITINVVRDIPDDKPHN